MIENVLNILKERGFVEQITDENTLSQALNGVINFYIGFDPTASSLHVGHLLPIMALSIMQKAGHRPIILLGGGTALIGDPSGKNEMRRVLSHKEITNNTEKVKEQLSKYVDFGGENRAVILNNAEWLEPLKYIEFLRDIGKHFSVNRMIAAESYKMRLETGLNFIEFNYMLLQSYDFLHLYKNYNCMLQMGGNDQWGNILSGIDLIRKVTGGSAYGLTFPLLTTASGSKMGKTEKGAVWLDPDRTSPYEFYQYWINADDRDVERFIGFFTFPSKGKPVNFGEEGENRIQKAKEHLAFEATSITHGKIEAVKARESSRSVFYGDGKSLDSLPSTEIPGERLKKGIAAYILFEETKLCSSRSDARRLINEGGAYINGCRVNVFDEHINENHLKDGVMLLRAGKKRYHKILLK
jgi:tyrosyl-tRNA synthetase